MRLGTNAVASTLAGLALLVAAGCGGDDKKKESGPLSRAALVETANAVCRRADAPEPAGGTSVAFDRLAELTKLYREDADRARSARAELGRLRARPQDRSQLRAVMKSLRDLAVLNDKVAQVHSAPELGVLGPFAVAANRVAFERAAALGARLCPPVSASPAYNVAVKDNRRHGKPVPPPVSERVNENGRNKSDPVREVPKPEPGHPVLGRWAGRLTQYGPGDYRTRFRVNLMLRSVTVGATGGVTKVPHQCSSALQVEKSTDRIAVYRETVTRGKGCYRSTVRTRVERQGERLTVRSTATTKEGRAVQLGILSRSR